MYRKIVVGYDGSAPGRKAFDVAVEIAQREGAELYVLTVTRPPDVGDDVESEAVIESSLHYHRRLLAPLRQIARSKGVKARFEALAGHPAEQIIYYADKIRGDLIVVGHRGRSKFMRLLLGSVSKQVVQYADRQVLVVR